MLQIFKKLSAYRLVNCIQKHGMLIQDHIRVVGYSVWNDVLALKEIQILIIGSDIFYCI